jgi:sugar O-acyltransferase (sialic acid O-acetyltransferase NeuD family)
MVILGSGSQGLITLDLCLGMGMKVKGFLDDTKDVGSKVNGMPVLGGFRMAWEGSSGKEVEYTVALGDPFARTEIFKRILAAGGRAATISHPKSFVSPFATIGLGSLISPFCFVNAGAQIGRFSLLEVGCHVGINNNLGKGVFLGPSCQLNADVKIGENSFLGTGTIVIPHRTIGAGAVVGAGSTVIEDIPPNKVAVGSPARFARGRRVHRERTRFIIYKTGVLRVILFQVFSAYPAASARDNGIFLSPASLEHAGLTGKDKIIRGGKTKSFPCIIFGLL